MKTLNTIFYLFFSLIAFAHEKNQIPSALLFIENKGQWESNILFKADYYGGAIYLEKNCITFDLANVEDLELVHDAKIGNLQLDEEGLMINKHCYKMYFDGANNNNVVLKKNQSSHFYNYFIGDDRNKWATEVYGFGEIIYQNIYPNIDLIIYSKGGNLKYDFILKTGADLNQIQLRYEGLDQILLKDGSLNYNAGFASLIENKPIAYIQTAQYQLPVSIHFQLDLNIVSFYSTQLFDKNFPLIIDPELIFASYSGSSFDNWGYTATYDNEGNLYGGGIVFGDGYPTTVGAYQTEFGGGDPSAFGFPYDNGNDIAISKFSSDGTALIYSTYLGGSGNELPHSLFVNEAGELIIYGTTGSDDFSVTAGAYDETFGGGDDITVDVVIEFPNGVDIFVAKLAADGASMVACTYVGGTENDGLNLATATNFNYGDFVRGEVISDASNNVYVASSTYSSNFPTTAGVFQTSIGGLQDGCIFKLNSNLTALTWSTFIGGTGNDGAYSLKRNSTGDIYVCGGTTSSGFPATSGTWHDTYQGGSADGWVANINSSASTINACSFIGTSNYDQTYFVETDVDDFIYITGQSKGTFSVIDADYSETGGKQFISKLSENLATVEYSTIFGSGSSSINISPSAFLVDDCQNVYVSGWGGTTNNEGSTSGMTTTADAIDGTTDGSDFYFFVLQKNAIDILYGSYFGGSSSAEHVDGGTSRFDKSGTIYQAVCAGCGGFDDFPTTDDAWSETNGSSNCNLGVGKIKLDLGGVYAISEADPAISGCVPFTVLFENLSSDAEDYIWDFGDGSPFSNEFEPTYTYTEIGVYTVTLIVIDSNSCNIADTAYLTIEVLNGDIVPVVDYEIIQDCDSLLLITENSSIVFPTTEYYWDFGDGANSTLEEPTHTYTEPGTYFVQLIISDSTSCNKLDTIEFEINYLFDFNTGYGIEVDGCLPVIAVFNAEFDSAEAYLWDFGDGSFATTQSATHEYFTPGEYLVTLTITYCGYTDVYTETFTVFDLPTAFFNSEPSFGIANAPTQFLNQSINAVSYLWEFSDGETSIEVDPIHYFPGLGNFEVCLTATNAAGCTDTYCRDISIEDEGAADVPTGFTPNNDGANDILFVKGFGFATLDFKVFNRWGELVFETTNQEIGWDGTLRAKPLDMDVFVFTLKVDFVDGKHFEKTGNVTLIR